MQLCHTSCDLLDAGTLKSFLSKISDWMDEHTSEVVTLLLVNGDSDAVADWGQAFVDSGITKHSFNGTMTKATDTWPTLQSMISSKQRLVSFITDIDTDPTYPYLRDEFDYIFETSYEVTDFTGFNCTLDRPVSTEPTAQDALAANYMGLINHFKEQTITVGVYIPDVESIMTTNSPNTTKAGELGKHMNDCKTSWGILPNFVLVDFWSAGDPIAAADNINGLKDVTGRSGSDSSDNNQTDTGSSMASGLGSDFGKWAMLAALVGSLTLF